MQAFSARHRMYCFAEMQYCSNAVLHYCRMQAISGLDLDVILLCKLRCYKYEVELFTLHSSCADDPA